MERFVIYAEDTKDPFEIDKPFDHIEVIIPCSLDGRVKPYAYYSHLISVSCVNEQCY